MLYGLGSLAGGGGSALDYDDAVEAIFDGKAADVVAELEDVAPADRSLAQDLVLGHAHAALGQDERALELYRVALPLRADGFALAVLTSRLDASAPPPTSSSRCSPSTRVERDGLGLVDVEGTALLDFVQTDSCGERRIALRVAGKSQGALDAVDRVGRAHESCFAGNELRGAYTAIKKRVGG